MKPKAKHAEWDESAGEWGEIEWQDDQCETEEYDSNRLISYRLPSRRAQQKLNILGLFLAWRVCAKASSKPIFSENLFCNGIPRVFLGGCFWGCENSMVSDSPLAQS